MAARERRREGRASSLGPVIAGPQGSEAALSHQRLPLLPVGLGDVVSGKGPYPDVGPAVELGLRTQGRHTRSKPVEETHALND